MRATPIVLCLGLLVVTAPLLACAQQSVAGGAAVADAQGINPDSATNIVTSTEPYDATSSSDASAHNDGTFGPGYTGVNADGYADSSAWGDSAAAVTVTGVAVNDGNAQSASLSGSQSEESLAGAGAVANAQAGEADVKTETNTVTVPYNSESTAESYTGAWGLPNNQANVDANGKAKSTALGENAQSLVFTATDGSYGQASSVSGGFSSAGRKLRSHMP